MGYRAYKHHPLLGGVPRERRGGLPRCHTPGTHPGPAGHPSWEGMISLLPSWEGMISLLPSLEGCRVSGGVGFGGRAGQEPTPALRATPPGRG